MYIFVIISFFNIFIVITMLEYSLAYRQQLSRKKPIARVVGGEDADPIKYAFVVALEKSRAEYNPDINMTIYRECTGSLINKHFVISAAHCSAADRIRYGDLTLPSTSEKASHSNITRKFLHTNFEMHNPRPTREVKRIGAYLKNDIGLYRVNPVHLSKYAQLSAVYYRTMTGLPVHNVGLGIAYDSWMGSSEVTKRIKEHETKERQIGRAIVKPCGKFLRGIIIYPRICLAWKCNSKQYVMPGDSGGPLFYDGKIIGVTAARVPSEGEIQSVFVPVSVYLDWIRRVTNVDD